jgi:hypothetical protein
LTVGIYVDVSPFLQILFNREFACNDEIQPLSRDLARLDSEFGVVKTKQNNYI